MNRFKNILVVATPEGLSDALLARAKWLAKANGARLTLIDVLDSNPGDLDRLLTVLPSARARDVEEKLRAHHAVGLTEAAQPLRDAGLEVATRLLSGVGFVEIIRHVLSDGTDLVLKAADRTPTLDVLGGPDLHLLRKCPCPVWVLHGAAGPAARRIVAAVDPDPEDAARDALNHQVMQLATSLARPDGARLDVVHAWVLYEESALRSALVQAPEAEVTALLTRAEHESAARLAHLTGAYAGFADLMHIAHVKGTPADVIVQHAENERTDTLVMGTLGRTGLAGLFIGNTAETVLNRVGCSVLAVKPEGFVSPVTLDTEAQPA